MSIRAAHTPVFIICRDKVTPLRQLVDWLESSGHQNIILVDNASTYPPITRYFDESPHEVVRLAENMGPHKSIWGTDLLHTRARGSYYVVTDSDVVPDEACPPDAIDFFHWALARFPTYFKAGFGLRIDDLPTSYLLADKVRAWESKFWTKPISRQLFDAAIDTTFALYRPDTAFAGAPALRSRAPYLARHIPWYQDSANRSEEDAYYAEHTALGVSHWDHEGENAVLRVYPPSRRRRIEWAAHVAFSIPRNKTVRRTYRSDDR